MGNFESEESIENHLIAQLTQGESQWTLRDDIRTIDALWENVRHILVQHNKDLFDEYPLTDNEFAQVKDQLSFLSFYDAAKFLTGENGVVRVDIQRDDATLGTVRPVVFTRQDVAGGSSVYEIVHQIQFPRKEVMNHDRRGDVTLLINGLPMIHIELKNRAHPYMDAFYQIKKYLKEGVFQGVFSTVQMFVVSNGSDTRYIAAAPEKGLNAKFLSTWIEEVKNPEDEDATPETRIVSDYLSFAKQVLSIPAAHQMVSMYTVLDSERKALIMLRPYQIHAIAAVRDAVNPNTGNGTESGYIWHTTGSGKTLTSYKTAQYLTRIPSVDKVVFIVDRKDLDNQTTGSFQAYAEFDTIDVDETDHVADLRKKLLAGKGDVVVTTIQKMQILIKRYPKDSGKYYDKLHGLHLIFVVDECHRAVSPEAQQKINQYFVHHLWYGFTGTPIFSEDAKSSKGDLPKTTEEQYGRRLNTYNIKDALRDGAVLGFQVEYRTTFDLADFARKNGVTEWKHDEDGYALEDVLQKQGLLDAAYEDEKHMRQVVDFIINQSAGKLGLDRGRGNTFTAILTTSSIKQAQRYYTLFQRVRAGEEPGLTIREEIKQKLPTFPKVAVTYSVTENKEDSSKNQDQMKAAMQDYNAMFGTQYTMDQLSAYNRNVNDRLARKKARYQVREEQLDIVIVVDRLLTGFDAPSLSTLFIDRRPMRSYNILQAFSRTNRLYDKQKRFGQIVIFQQPAHFKRAVDAAMKRYSEGGGSYVEAPSWQEAEERFRQALAALRSLAPTPEHINTLSKSKKLQFLKAYRTFDNAYADLQVYSEYQDKDLKKDYGIDSDSIEAYNGKFENLKEELKDEDDTDDIEVNTAISYELRCQHVDMIDEEYLLRLMEATREDESAMFTQNAQANEKVFAEIQKEIQRFRKTNPARAAILETIWKEYQENPADFVNHSFAEILSSRVHEQVYALEKAFAEEWCVDLEELSYCIDNYDPSKDPDNMKDKQVGEDALYKKSNPRAYMEKHPDIGMKYKRYLKKAIHELYVEKLQKLMKA